MTNKPIMYTWLYMDNIEGEINFTIGDKFYKYKFNNDVRNTMLEIKRLMKFTPFAALNLAKKMAYNVEKL